MKIRSFHLPSLAVLSLKRALTTFSRSKDDDEDNNDDGYRVLRIYYVTTSRAPFSTFTYTRLFLWVLYCTSTRNVDSIFCDVYIATASKRPSLRRAYVIPIAILYTYRMCTRTFDRKDNLLVDGNFLRNCIFQVHLPTPTYINLIYVRVYSRKLILHCEVIQKSSNLGLEDIL